MIHPKSILSIFSFALFSITQAQNPTITWQQTMGGTQSDNSKSTLSDGQGGMYALGTSSSGATGNKSEASFGSDDAWLIHIDQYGAVLGTTAYGGTRDDWGRDMIRTVDHLYIANFSRSGISGNKTVDSIGGGDFWIIAGDLAGNIEWQGVYGGIGHDRPEHMITLPNGNLLVGGYTNSDISGNKTEASRGLSDIWLVELSASDGSIVRQKTIGTSGYNQLLSVVADQQGNIYVLGAAGEEVDGDKTSTGYGWDDAWLIQLDSQLNIVTEKSYGGDSADGGTIGTRGGIVVTDDRIYFACQTQSDVSGVKTAPHRSSQPYYRDTWIVCLQKSDLSIVWDKSFGGAGSDDPVQMIAQPFQKLAVLIYSESSNSYPASNRTIARKGQIDSWLVILDYNGEIVAQESYGGTLAQGSGNNPGRTIPAALAGDEAGNLYLATNSDCKISGQKTEDNFGNSSTMDYWLLKLDASDYLSLTQQATLILPEPHPNPFSNKTAFDFTRIDEELTIRFYNAQGQLVDTKKAAPHSVFEWTATGDSQFYLYEISGATVLSKGRMLKY